jgi:hypothetical protein
MKEKSPNLIIFAKILKEWKLTQALLKPGFISPSGLLSWYL